MRPCAQPCGTIARYIAGCRCFACRVASAAYQAEWKRGPSRTVDAASVTARIALLRANGWRTRGIAEQSGSAYSTVRALREGRRARVNRDTAAAILDLPVQTPFPTDSTALVPARPTLRLISRLRSQGHTAARIAAACGVEPSSLPRRGQRSVQARTAKRVREAAARLRAEARG